MASPADGLSENRSNYSKDHYDSNRDQFKVLEWTLERLINKTGLKKLEPSSKEKPDFEQLTLYLSDIDQTQAPLHLGYHIQSSYPKLTERIKINTSMPAENSLSPDTLAELKPHSVHLTYSDFIIPEQLTQDDHREYLHSKIKQVTELASLCTETDDQGLIYIYDYLKEPELYQCVEPGAKHPYGHPIIGEIPKYQGDESLSAALQETFGEEEINIALIKPCPCLYRQENTCTHPGNPPDNDNIYIDSDYSDEDTDTD